MLLEKRDWIVGFLEAELHNAVLQQVLDIVLAHIGLALLQGLILAACRRRTRSLAITGPAGRVKIEQIQIHFVAAKILINQSHDFTFDYIIYSAKKKKKIKYFQIPN